MTMLFASFTTVFVTTASSTRLVFFFLSHDAIHNLHASYRLAPFAPSTPLYRTTHTPTNVHQGFWPTTHAAQKLPHGHRIFKFHGFHGFLFFDIGKHVRHRVVQPMSARKYAQTLKVCKVRCLHTHCSFAFSVHVPGRHVTPPGRKTLCEKTQRRWYIKLNNLLIFDNSQFVCILSAYRF